MQNQEPVKYRCFKCGDPLHFDVKIGRRDMCPNCYAYLHCCRNCKFWDPSVHNECNENRAEFIRDREEGNFCLYFTFREVDDGGVNDEEKAKADLKRLFGFSTEDAQRAPKTEDDARRRLEDLFKKR